MRCAATACSVSTRRWPMVVRGIRCWQRANYLSGVNVHSGSKGIELDGTEIQRRKWLPELASGRLIAAFALSEPGVGSDARAIATTAVRDGPPGLSVGPPLDMLAGNGSTHAEVIFQDCRIPAENLLGAREGRGFSTAMKCLDAGRVCWGAYCVGAAEELLRYGHRPCDPP